MTGDRFTVKVILSLEDHTGRGGTAGEPKGMVTVGFARRQEAEH
jgi:hypothetical protein